MASNLIPFPGAPANGPQQPDLRPFIVYDALPENCITFEIENDRMSPWLRRGDFAIVDVTDREPVHGELSLIQWLDGGRAIVEVGKFPRPEKLRPRPDQRPAEHYYNLYWKMPLHAFAGEYVEHMRWADGPYPDWHLEEKLIGRVVGLYQPDFRLQLAA